MIAPLRSCCILKPNASFKKSYYMEIQKSTHDLFHAFRSMIYAELYLCSVINDKKVYGSAKQFLNVLLGRIRANVRDLRSILPPDDVKILDNDMLNPDIVLQFQNINDMVSLLDGVGRDRVEAFIEEAVRVHEKSISLNNLKA